MDAIELRLMFVGGLLVLGAATLLASAAAVELKGWVERYRMPGTRQTSPARWLPGRADGALRGVRAHAARRRA